MTIKRVSVVTAVIIMFLASSIYASQCVECHTDVEKLKAIAKTIPKPVASAETTGKG
ncbi:MAG: hypothetical protein PF441_06780 [Desulfuromusa sp.]|jgi:hypothetical protein|nr:hypothetical protein [Desulfuromusa sp.]